MYDASFRRSMWSLVLCLSCVTVAAAAVCSGCAAPGPRGELPLGQWAGRGTFVYERWAPSDDPTDRSGPPSIHRDYPTTLSIQRGTLDGRDVIEMDIVSDRGKLPDLGDGTKLTVALVKARQVSADVTLYRIVGSLFNPDPGETMTFDDERPPFTASAMTRDGVTVFQIQYGEDFVDTIRFDGRRAEKSGVYFEEDKGLVHWSESLTRR